MNRVDVTEVRPQPQPSSRLEDRSVSRQGDGRTCQGKVTGIGQHHEQQDKLQKWVFGPEGMVGIGCERSVWQKARCVSQSLAYGGCRNGVSAGIKEDRCVNTE